MPRSPLYEKFEQCLQQAREARELTQAQVASRLRKPQSYVSKYETGERRLDVVEFLEVCKALNIRPTDVLKAMGV